ncbi:MAG TPA: PEP-CTERM sorting domain-containing protein [Lentisphaerae bacterium]|jgi:hypothetical protein|nr:PEP-CTERM sorting domain-containing protein [Lentisphaerota bacterium]
MRLVAKHILATIVVLSAPIAALALPVIEWDTVRVSYDYGPWGEVRFSLRTEHSFSPADCWGGGEREADGWWTTLHQESGSIAAAFRFFVVHYGDLVDFDLSESSEIIFGNEGWEHPALRLDWDQPLYLGFRLGYPEYASEALRAEYGWAKLLFDGETVHVLGSATERTGLGIYAGTGTAIPEPATTGLLLMGVAGILWKPCRTRVRTG